MNSNNIEIITNVIKDIINDSIEEIVLDKFNHQIQTKIKPVGNQKHIEIIKNELNLSIKKYVDEIIDIVFADCDGDCEKFSM